MKSITIIAAVAVLATIMTTGAVYAHTPNIDWKVNYDTILAQYQELWNQHQVISGLYNNTQAQIDRLDRILNDTRTNLDSAHDRINAQSADILIYKNQITNLQSSSDHWKAEALQKEDTVKKLKGDKKNLKNTIADLEDQVEKLKDRIQNKKQNANEDSQEMEALKAEIQTMKAQMEESGNLKEIIQAWKQYVADLHTYMTNTNTIHNLEFWSQYNIHQSRVDSNNRHLSQPELFAQINMTNRCNQDPTLRISSNVIEIEPIPSLYQASGTNKYYHLNNSDTYTWRHMHVNVTGTINILQEPQWSDYNPYPDKNQEFCAHDRFGPFMSHIFWNGIESIPSFE